MAIVVPIISEWNPKGVERSIADVKKAEGKWGKAGAAMKAGLAPALGVLGGLGALGAKFASMAAEDEKSAAVLAKSLKNVAGASDETVKSVEGWISAQGKMLGVADDQLRPALSTLAMATKDVGKAQELGALAMDLAAAKGISLESASTAIAKAYSGQTGALKKLVPGLSDAALKSGDFAAVQGELAGVVGGAAATAAGTTAGKMEILRLRLSETAEAIGAALIPIISRLLDALAPVITLVEENTELFLKLAAAAAVIAGAIVAVNVAMKAYAVISKAIKIATAAWTAVQWLLNVALTANPIGLVVAAIALLIAGIVLAWKKSETFRNIVTGAFKGVMTVVKTVVDFIVKVWKSTFDLVLSVATKVIDKVRAAFDAISGVITGVMDKIKGVISKIPIIGGLVNRSASSVERAAGAMARAGGSSTTSSTVVNVYGAVDPDATARTLRAILTASDARQGRDYGTTRALAW